MISTLIVRVIRLKQYNLEEKVLAFLLNFSSILLLHEYASHFDFLKVVASRDLAHFVDKMVDGSLLWVLVPDYLLNLRTRLDGLDQSVHNFNLLILFY